VNLILPVPIGPGTGAAACDKPQEKLYSMNFPSHSPFLTLSMNFFNTVSEHFKTVLFEVAQKRSKTFMQKLMKMVGERVGTLGA
jgi:hypothetical protein